MKLGDFLGIFKGIIGDFYKNWRVVVLGVLLWGILFLFSRISVHINYQLRTYSAWIISAWAIMSILIFMFLLSVMFSGMIGLAKEKIKRGIGRRFIGYVKKYTIRSFIVLVIMSLVFMLIQNIAHYGALFIGKGIGLSLTPAQILFFAIYLGGVMGILIFISLSQFCLVVYALGIWGSLKKSISIVKNNYLYVLSVDVILFLLFYFTYFLADNYASALEYILLVPLMVFFFTRFLRLSED